MGSNSTSGRAAEPALVRGDRGGVLLLSMRRMKNLVAFCAPYEFEDVFAEVTGADRVEPADLGPIEAARRIYKYARLATRSRRVALAAAPQPPHVRLDRTYELFFPVFNQAYELFALATVPEWRKRCRVAACFVSELWVHELPNYLLELLSEFDHVFIGVRQPVEEVARVVGRPCSYLPLGVDVPTFSPFPDPPPRAIDVCNLGRRSSVTHAALVELARGRRLSYYFDTVAASGVGLKQRTFQVENASEHRLLLATVLKRSRYYAANRARANEPEYTQGTDEISGRYYEGAAAGTVIFGDPPRTDEFRRQFDWPDAVVKMPFDSPDVARILSELDADPKRLAAIRRSNVRHAALRHDWVYRIRTVFDALGLAPKEAMLAREERLRALADLAMAAPMEDG